MSSLTEVQRLIGLSLNKLQMGRAGRDGQQSVAINLSRAVKVPGEANLPFLALISVLQALQSRTFLLPRGACPSR